MANGPSSPPPDVAAIPRLRPGQISPLGLSALAVGILSPALGLYALWGPIQLATGAIAPLVFLTGALLSLPTALSYVELNRVMPSAGAASTWLWRTVSPSFGYFIGLTMATYFLMGALAQPILFGLFFQDLIHLLGVPLPLVWIWAIALVAATAPIMWAAARGAEVSTRMAVILMALECIVVLALSATVLAVKAHEPGGIDLHPFNPATATRGFAGFWEAALLGLLAFAGFDVVSTAAEETSAPAQHVPKAIVLTILAVTLFWAFNSWVFTLALPGEKVREYSLAGMTAVTPMARQFWGRGNILVILSAFTGITAIYVSTVLGSSRIIFSMARRGLLPGPLAAVDSRYGVPRRATHIVFAILLVADVASLLAIRNGLEVFTWWANAQVFFMMLTFAGVNVANVAYFTRIDRANFRPVRNLLVPLLGLSLNAVVLYEAFFRALWHAESILQRSVVAFCVGLTVIYWGVVVLLRWWAPERLQGAPPLFLATDAE